MSIILSYSDKYIDGEDGREKNASVDLNPIAHHERFSKTLFSTFLLSVKRITDRLTICPRSPCVVSAEV